jgi:hypothetical protein
MDSEKTSKIEVQFQQDEISIMLKRGMEILMEDNFAKQTVLIDQEEAHNLIDGMPGVADYKLSDQEASFLLSVAVTHALTSSLEEIQDQQLQLDLEDAT